MKFYNGYSSKEREAKLRAMHRQFPGRSHPCYRGPCDMCGDPASPVAPHSEDYSLPYLWDRPAVYALCRTCHSRLHKRFLSVPTWNAYKAHLKRGGHGADLKQAAIAKEIRNYLAAGAEPKSLRQLRSRTSADPWWDTLSTAAFVLTSPSARPRP